MTTSSKKKRAAVVLTRKDAMGAVLQRFRAMGGESHDEGSPDEPQHEVCFAEDEDDVRVTLLVLQGLSVRDLAARVVGTAIRWREPTLVVAECDPFRRPMDWQTAFAREVVAHRPFSSCDTAWSRGTAQGRGVDGLAYDGTGLACLPLMTGDGGRELPETTLARLERWVRKILPLPRASKERSR